MRKACDRTFCLVGQFLNKGLLCDVTDDVGIRLIRAYFGLMGSPGLMGLAEKNDPSARLMGPLVMWRVCLIWWESFPYLSACQEGVP